jgi:hypothetical protein
MKTDEQTVTEIAKLLEHTRSQAYANGYEQGRRDMANEVEQGLERVFRTVRTVTPHPKPAKQSAAPVDSMPQDGMPEVVSIEAAVAEALGVLAEHSPPGVEPQALVEFFADSPLPLDIKEVRAALRHLTMNGEAHRVGDGRYLPGAANEAVTSQPETVTSP